MLGKGWKEADGAMLCFTATLPTSHGHYLRVRGRDYERAKRYFELQLSRQLGDADFKLAWERRGF